MIFTWIGFDRPDVLGLQIYLASFGQGQRKEIRFPWKNLGQLGALLKGVLTLRPEGCCYFVHFQPVRVRAVHIHAERQVGVVLDHLHGGQRYLWLLTEKLNF